MSAVAIASPWPAHGVVMRFLPIPPLLFEEHEDGDVFHPMDDVGQTSIDEDGPVHRAPVMCLKFSTLGAGTAYVVLLHRRGVGLAGAKDLLERGPQIALAGSGGIIWVVGKTSKRFLPTID